MSRIATLADLGHASTPRVRSPSKVQTGRDAAPHLGRATDLHSVCAVAVEGERARVLAILERESRQGDLMWPGGCLTRAWTLIESGES